MYHYIEDKEFLKKMKSLCSDIVNQLVQAINKEFKLEVEAHLVGSGARNLITQNANEPIDLDYNLFVKKIYDIKLHDGRELSEYIRKKFNEVLNKNGWGDCCDSTSVFTTEKRHFITGNHTQFSIDLAIVKRDNNGWHCLIHQKTGITFLDRYYWNTIPDSREVFSKVDAIKREKQWKRVIDTYLDKKNMYLKRGDRDHPSFIVYVETVNEIFGQLFSNRKL